jgi:hypothetical protein
MADVFKIGPTGAEVDLQAAPYAITSYRKREDWTKRFVNLRGGGHLLAEATLTAVYYDLTLTLKTNDYQAALTAIAAINNQFAQARAFTPNGTVDAVYSTEAWGNQTTPTVLRVTHGEALDQTLELVSSAKAEVTVSITCTP